MGTVFGGESDRDKAARRKARGDAADAANARAAAKAAAAAAKAKKIAAEKAAADKKKKTANELAGQQSQAGKLALIATSQGGLQGEASTGKRKLFGN